MEIKKNEYSIHDDKIVEALSDLLKDNKTGE